MSLFPNPTGLVPLLERAVDALESIAAELVTARLDRRQHMTVADMDDEAEKALVECHNDNHAPGCTCGDMLCAAEKAPTQGRYKPHPIGTVTGCRDCRKYRLRHDVSVTNARDFQNELPACPGGAA